MIKLSEFVFSGIIAVMQHIQNELLQPKLTPFVGTIAESESPFTIVSYNVHFGKKTSSISDIFLQNDNLKNADIILLQEVEEHVVEHSSRATRIAESLGYHCLYAPAQIRKQKGTHGLAIFESFAYQRF